MLVYRSDHRAQSRTVQALMKGNRKQDPGTSYCGAGRQIVDEAISQIHNIFIHVNWRRGGTARWCSLAMNFRFHGSLGAGAHRITV